MAILGVLTILIVVGVFLYLPEVGEEIVTAARDFYESYIDWMVVVAAGIIALITTATVLGFYVTEGNPRDAYIAAAVFVYLIKLALTLMDTVVPDGRFLIDTVSHLMDLAIILLLFMGAVKSH